MSDTLIKIYVLADPRALRRLVLRELAVRAEEYHARRIAPAVDDETRIAAVVAVIDEASAYWALESDDRLLSVAQYRELADDTLRVITERIPSLVADVLGT